MRELVMNKKKIITVIRGFSQQVTFALTNKNPIIKTKTTALN